MDLPVKAALVGFNGAHFSTQSLEVEIGKVFSITRDREADVLFVREDFASIQESLTRFEGTPLRVLFSAELRGANFDLFDFVIGWEYDLVSPRYFRLPTFFRESWFFENHPGSSARKNDETKEFCNFIYSNSRAHPFRDQFFHALNDSKAVHSFGRHLNNRAVPADILEQGLPWGLEKIAIQENYDFSIAIENGCYKGYTTEKLITAFLAGTIPIYWGNPSVVQEFNHQRLVSLHDFAGVEDAVKFILELSEDKERLEFMKAQPLFTREQEAQNEVLSQELAGFLEGISQASLSGQLLRPTGTLTDESERLFRQMAGLQEYIEKVKHLASTIIQTMSRIWKRS